MARTPFLLPAAPFVSVLSPSIRPGILLLPPLPGVILVQIYGCGLLALGTCPAETQLCG